MTKVNKKIYVADWNYAGDRVRLIFRDGSEYYIRKTDFDRAMGAIFGADKEAIQRDFPAA